MKGADIQVYLTALGDLLAGQQVEVGVVLVGGAALLLQGLRVRTTTDIDMIAAIKPGMGDRTTLISPGDLPASFNNAVRRVARDFGLPANWINAEVSRQLETGLPPGFTNRITWTRYGGLRVGLAGRRDLIFLKLFAATDQDPGSRHTQDLIALKPTDAELDAAAAWVRTQDAAEGFATMVNQVLAHVKAHPA